MTDKGTGPDDRAAFTDDGPRGTEDTVHWEARRLVALTGDAADLLAFVLCLDD